MPDHEETVAKRDKKRQRKKKSKDFVDDDDDDDDSEDSEPEKKKKKRGRKKKDASNGDSVENGGTKEKKKPGRKKKSNDEETNGTPKVKKPRKIKNNEDKVNGEKKSKKNKIHTTKNNHKVVKGPVSKRSGESSNSNKVPEKLRQAQSIKFNVEKYKDVMMDKSSSHFKKVVDAFRPASHYIKRLIDKDSHDMDRSLQKIGDFIVDYVWKSDK